MEELLLNLKELIVAIWGVLTAVIWLLLPWTPLAAWIAFWMFAVNWVKLREVLVRGGIIGIFLVGFVMILIWGVVAPPLDGSHYMLGLKLSNFVGKTVYVTALFVIMFLCGSVQLSGGCSSCFSFENEAADTESPGH